MVRGGLVYILTNKNKTTLYVGVTSDIVRRLHEHRTGKYQGSFSKRYNLHYLVYYEVFQTIQEAIAREKQLKAGNRARKEQLINSINPKWLDLSEQFGINWEPMD